jgi:hypothetical protein
MGNEQSVIHQPSPYHAVTSTTAPKSVMRRSRSIVAQADDMGPTTKDNTRYIPKMNRTESNGLIMPTRPYGADLSGNGVESPQWGWYITTTPPSPDLYNSHASKTSKPGTNAPLPTVQQPPKSCHNQVFQNLQNSKAPMGWTSVPI